MRTLRSLLLATCWALPVAAQQVLSTPEQALGHQIGADYFLPPYTQLQRWWEQLAKQSSRMRLDTIGLTAEGRPQLMAILSSPANLARLEEYRRTSESLARGRVDSSTARRLAQSGKAVIWIDGGLHADEVLGANQLLELVWQMVSMNDPETLRILNDDIILAVQVNPDGMELVANWYMRNADSLRRSTGGLPRLYEKYAGHDDNRDWYRAALPETQNGERIQYHVWYPQIIYNHHQTGPAGSVMFTPPFRDPFNYFFDPLIPSSIDWVGMAMQRRFAAEGKPGIVDKNSTSYSTWWNGGLRTAGYFHNMIGILTEAIGNPTPQNIQLVLDRQLPSGDGIYPVKWGPWHFRQSIDYSMTANRAILDLASKYREDLLFNFWRMGRNSIDRGSNDTWTTTPRTIAAAQKAIGGTVVPEGPSTDTPGGGGGGRAGRVSCATQLAATLAPSSSRPDNRNSRRPSTSCRRCHSPASRSIARRQASQSTGKRTRPDRSWCGRTSLSVHTFWTCLNRSGIQWTCSIPAARPSVRTTMPATRWHSRWDSSLIASWKRCQRTFRLPKSRMRRLRRCRSLPTRAPRHSYSRPRQTMRFSR